MAADQLIAGLLWMLPLSPLLDAHFHSMITHSGAAQVMLPVVLVQWVSRLNRSCRVGMSAQLQQTCACAMISPLNYMASLDTVKCFETVYELFAFTLVGMPHQKKKEKKKGGGAH